MEKLEVDLLPHNQKAYESATKMLEENGRAAIIHPTGTGKSYIALKLIQDNSDKKILYIAPSLAILDKMNEKIEQFGINKDKIEILSYQKLNSMRKSGELDTKHYEIIIIDEFHHYTGEKWATAIDMLLENNSDAKVLGLTATPLRYGVGHEVRDIADEVFGNFIASEMNTQTAIDKGILPIPDYTVGIYDYIDILENLKSIESKKNENELYKEQVKEIEERLKKAVDTLPDLLAEKMQKKNGKYLIFCSTIEDMNEKIEEAQKLFEKVNKNITIRSISSEDREHQKNKDTINEFENDKNPDTLKLMFCVDMLNEGYHLEELDGGIMIRKTNSPTLYTQQLGRLLQTTKGENPIIIDLVNNIDAIREIEGLARELNGEKNRKINFKFKISRETEDIFEKIDELMDRKKRKNPNNEKYDRVLLKLNCPRKIIMNDQNVRKRCFELEKLKAKRDEIEEDNKEKKALNKIIKNIRDKIITDNMWLAEGIAKQIEIQDMEDEEKIELAYQGLIETIDNMKLNSHRIFSRECVKNIYQILKTNEKETPLEQYLENYSNKEDLLQAIDIIENTIEELQQELFTEDVGLEAISERTGFDIRVIQKLMEIKKNAVQQENPESFEETIDKSNKYEYEDGIYNTNDDEILRYVSTVIPKSDDVEEITEKEVLDELLKENLYEVLDTIKEREKIVLVKHHGIDGEEEKSYERIGKEDLGVTVERIRQIYSRAARELRYPLRSKKISMFSSNESLDKDNTEYIDATYSEGRIADEDINFLNFATELLNNDYIKEKTIQLNEINQELEQLENLSSKEEKREIETVIRKVDSMYHEVYWEIVGEIRKIGEKYNILQWNEYIDYFIKNNLEGQERLKEKALRIKLKRDLIEFKIPEKQKLQREYQELSKEKNEKGDK